MQDSKILSADRPDRPVTLTEIMNQVILIPSRLAVSCFGTLFIFPVWIFLFAPKPIEEMIMWEGLAGIASAMAVFVLVSWEKKGEIPKLPYDVIGIVNMFAFFVAVVAIISTRDFLTQVNRNQVLPMILHLSVLLLMCLVTLFARKVIKDKRKGISVSEKTNE